MAVEIACNKKIDLSQMDHKQLKDFKNMPHRYLSEAGLLLLQQAESDWRYYKNIQTLISSKATSSVRL